jgi:hypothetical protein
MSKRLTTAMKRNGWFRNEDGRLARRHTKVSALIFNEISGLFYFPGGGAKIAFRIEDKLREEGLLSDVKE